MIYIVGITLLGAYLRFYGLGSPPLWIDEAMLGIGMLTYQEYIGNILILFLPHTDFWLRFPYALCGTLTIPAVYFIGRSKKWSGWAALFVAVFPLFVFWSRMARPYALAGLFLILGWRWWWMHLMALLSTPMALVGVNLLKTKWWQITILVVCAVVLYLTRPDVLSGKNFFDLDFISKASRLWYLPILTGIMWLLDWRKIK